MKRIVKCIKASFSLLVGAAFICVGCSDIDAGGEVPDKVSPYGVLGEGNANMPSGGTIVSEYSDSPVGSEIIRLVDNNKETCFSTPRPGFNITWNGTKEAVVRSYTLASATDEASLDPSSWRLEASKDNKKWVVLDEQIDQTFSGRKEVKSYGTDNLTAYKYYRLKVTGNNGGASTRIAEWTLSVTEGGNGGGTPPELDLGVLMEKAGGNTHTDITPMGTQYAEVAGHTTTDADRTWLKDPKNEPDLLSGVGAEWMECTDINLYPYGDPSPADVNQHAIGDCSALAVFASLAYIYPDFIKSIVKDNHNGSYTVMMYDPEGNRVEVCVSNKFLKEGNGNMAAVSGKTNNVTWATVMEKAIMKWRKRYMPSDKVSIGGIGSEHTAPLFTGNGDSFAFDRGKLSADELQKAITSALKSGKIVIGGFGIADLQAGDLKTVTGHAFTAMYTVSPEALFAMRNPWGNQENNGRQDGVLVISDDGIVPPTIDIRIVESGLASNYWKGTPGPYIPPQY